jgi:hypothetical protein
LQRAVQRRARRAFVASLAAVTAHRRPDALVPVTIRVEDVAPSVSGRLALDASRVALRLRPAWLWSVWADGGALHEGRFVVSRDELAVDTLVWRPTGRGAREHLPYLEPVRLDRARR